MVEAQLLQQCGEIVFREDRRHCSGWMNSCGSAIAHSEVRHIGASTPVDLAISREVSQRSILSLKP